MKRRGFTLVELVVVLGILGLLSVSFGPVYVGVRESWDLHSSSGKVLSGLRLAKTKSMSGDLGLSWGVKVGGNLVIFAGDSYATRDASLDIVEKNIKIEASGDTEVVFTKNTGKTTPGQIFLSNNSGKRKIVFNSYGASFGQN